MNPVHSAVLACLLTRWDNFRMSLISLIKRVTWELAPCIGAYSQTLLCKWRQFFPALSPSAVQLVACDFKHVSLRGCQHIECPSIQWHMHRTYVCFCVMFDVCTVQVLNHTYDGNGNGQGIDESAPCTDHIYKWPHNNNGIYMYDQQSIWVPKMKYELVIMKYRIMKANHVNYFDGVFRQTLHIHCVAPVQLLCTF